MKNAETYRYETEKKRTRIKICGLQSPCDIEYVNELLPDYIGFVFARQSKRYITPKEAEVLRKKLDNRILPTGVFVNEERETIAELVKRNIISAVQLHGTETEEDIQCLRGLAVCPIIKAFRVKGQEEIKLANQSVADYVLLDSGGGSGETFDWSLLKEMQRPYFLAGGLRAENVAEAIHGLQPFAVDASSSLETEGRKDRAKMAAFVRAVRQA
ncbi:MAG: phosphoribosylanthranilate isomerase [Lachnospiraceae bacterium]|nr:phosphoribosylanthranilate isomerase [Lachnospiraceae bacterium]